MKRLINSRAHATIHAHIVTVKTSFNIQCVQLTHQ